MIIRPMTIDDVQAVAEIQDAAWREAYGGIVPEVVFEKQTVAKRRERFERRLEEAGEETVVVEEQGKVVGFATFGRSRDEDGQEGRTGEVWGIYLSPKHWRKGIGRRLMGWVVEMLRQRGYREVTLWVLEQNSPARRFYEAMDFRSDGAAKSITLGVPLTEIRYRAVLADKKG